MLPSTATMALAWSPSPPAVPAGLWMRSPLAVSPTTVARPIASDARNACRLFAHPSPTSSDVPRLQPLSSSAERVDELEIELDDIEVELDVRHVGAEPPEDTADAAAAELISVQKDATTPPPPMKVADGASIIAGTAIGGGFLALPSATSPIGYLPTAVGLVATWGFLLMSAFAFLEAAGLVHDARRSRRRRNGDAATTSTETAEAEGEGSGSSISSIIHEAFGKRWAVVVGLAFVAQMVAVMTIQIVKGAAITSQLLPGVPYAVAAFVPTSLAGWFVFSSETEVVEGANTLLTAAMVGGFGALIVAALAVGNAGGAAGGAAVSSVVASPFARANWSSLIPSGRVTWSVPVLMKLLAWGEAMPLISERMAQQGGAPSSGAAANAASEQAAAATQQAAAQRKAKRATALGSSIPLIACLVWAAISTAFVDPAHPDPITYLLQSRPAIAIPVGLLSFGAIGTSILASFLAMGHFSSDVICTKLGTGTRYSRRTWTNVARVLTVAVPSLLACAGPGIYLPLLAFAGAYPTTLLYGLAPSLAVTVLRRRLKREGGFEKTELTPRLVPGGRVTLAALMGTSVGIVGVCTALAIRQVLRAAAGVAFS